jgi:hypothetical protein
MEFMIQLIKDVWKRSSMLRVLRHDNRFVWNVGTILPGYAASHPRRL